MSNQDITQPATIEQPYVLPTIDDLMPPLPKSPGKESAAAVKYGEVRKRVGKMIDTANGKLEEAQDACADALRRLNTSNAQNTALEQRGGELRRETEAAQGMAQRLGQLWPARAVLVAEIGAYTGHVPEASPSTVEPLEACFRDSNLGFRYHFSSDGLTVDHVDCPDSETFALRYWEPREVLSASDWHRLSGFMVRCVGSDRLAGRLPARFNVSAVDSVDRIQALTAHLERALLPEILLDKEFGGIDGLMVLVEQLRRQAGI